MVTDSLNELLQLSEELATLKDKPPQVKKAPPADLDLHPQLIELLNTRAYALKRMGIDAHKVEDLTDEARRRGLRRKVHVFGRGRRGATWYAVPERKTRDLKILIIDRANRLATTEVDLDGFVEHCIETTRKGIEVAKEKEAERLEKEAKAAAARAATRARVRKMPKVPPPTDDSAPVIPEKLRGTREVKVRLPDSDGATVLADGKSVEFTPEEWAYVIWSMDALQILPSEPTPDLTRWTRRCLRTCRMDEVPEEGTPERETYDTEWLRITRRDRRATSKSKHGVPSWKLTATGRWELTEEEAEVLGKARLSTPPRHKPNKKQKAIWKRWTGLMDVSPVEILVH